jgi:hypothetical protein
MPTETISADEWNRRQRAANPKLWAARDKAAGLKPRTPKPAATQSPHIRNPRTVAVTIPGWPPSANLATGKHWKAWRAAVNAYRATALPCYNGAALPTGDAYQFTLTLSGKGRGDLSNRVKAAEDVAAEALGYNDRLNARVVIEWGDRTGEPTHTVRVEGLTPSPASASR